MSGKKNQIWGLADKNLNRGKILFHLYFLALVDVLLFVTVQEITLSSSQLTDFL